MKVDINIVEGFFTLQANLPDILKSYGIRQNFIAEKAGISMSTFYRKLKTQTFTAEEMRNICKAINEDIR